jgi:hypothetical protein
MDDDDDECGTVGGLINGKGNRNTRREKLPQFHFLHHKSHMKRKKRVVDLERGPDNLVITSEELLDRKVAAPV